MAYPILSTKLFVPPLRADQLPRPHLIEKLNEGAAYPLTLVSASAGSGKTTLLAEWVTQNSRPTAWISFDSGDNDPIVFLTYLIASLQTIRANFAEDALALIQSRQAESLEGILVNLINALTEPDQACSLIFDDFHTITDPRTNELVTFLLEHLPPHIHLVVASRMDPPWALARYRARNQLYEIRGHDLRFSTPEAAEFLNRTLGLHLAVEDVKALERRTEGWIAGMQLVALSIQGREDVSAFVKAFTGSHMFVAEYLVEEVLQRQPEGIQRFLIQTSLLKRMNASLVETVTGCQDGQAILQSLYRGNIFVIPLDSEGGWFRYHHLFSDLLLARLRHDQSVEEIAALQLLAADWFERNGFLLEAVSHAFEAKDFERAAALLDRAGQSLIFTDQYTTLKTWLDALPEESFQTHLRLEIYRVLIDLSLGKIDMFEQTLLEKERLIKSLPASPENDRLRLEAMVYLSAFMAHQNTSRAIQMAQEALGQISESDLRLKSSLYATLYRAYGMEGDIEKSAPAYRESLRLAQAAGMYGMVSNTTMVRAFDLCQYGRLDEAARYCQQVIDAGMLSRQKVYYPAAPCYIGLAGIHLERHELDQAEAYLKQGLELSHQGARYSLYTGYIQKARLHQAKGELEEAVNTLEMLGRTIQRMDFTLTAQQVAVRLASGDQAGASSLVDPLLEILGQSYYAQKLPRIAAEAFKLSLARIYVAQEELEKAARLLDEIQVTVEAGKRNGRLMEVYILKARVAHQQEHGGVSSNAIAYLERALELAQPAGFVTLFLEEGPSLVPILQAVLENPSAPACIKQYAARLLEAFGISTVPQPTDDSAGLVEPLTPREMEVLRRLALGDSNQVIADKLVITVRTVKKHTSNIYGKLNAANRTQAVALARQLGLLPADQ